MAFEALGAEKTFQGACAVTRRRSRLRAENSGSDGGGGDGYRRPTLRAERLVRAGAGAVAGAMATRVQATTPPSGLSPRASAVAVCAVVACLALLWPRLIAPPQDLSPNINDKATGTIATSLFLSHTHIQI